MSKRTTSVLSTVAVVVLTVVVWWLQAGDDGGDDRRAETPRPTASATAPTDPATSLPERAASPTASATALPATDPVSGLPYVELSDLPPEASDTLLLIDAGGPFPYGADGSTFHNYEGLLPDHEDGYYREYTVETPGSADRGARRIVGGAAGELYWTEDHYESFEVIRR